MCHKENTAVGGRKWNGEELAIRKFYVNKTD
jgi:hypothetical protein